MWVMAVVTTVAPITTVTNVLAQATDGIVGLVGQVALELLAIVVVGIGMGLAFVQIRKWGTAWVRNGIIRDMERDGWDTSSLRDR